MIKFHYQVNDYNLFYPNIILQVFLNAGTEHRTPLGGINNKDSFVVPQSPSKVRRSSRRSSIISSSTIGPLTTRKSYLPFFK